MKMRTVAIPAVALSGAAAWLLANAAFGAAREVVPSTPTDLVSQDAEGFEWFWAINGPVSADAIGSMSVDAEGSVFVAGGHGGLDMDRDGVVDIESGSTAHVGASNPFFMKLSRGPSDDRVRLRWTRSPRSPGDRTQSSIAADGRGGAFVAGAFAGTSPSEAGTVEFDGGPTIQGAGGNDAYIARYDAAGTVVWAKAFGGPGSDGIYGVASDRAENVYVAALGSGKFPLDESGAEFRAEGERAAVLLSYGPDGELRWWRVFESSIPLVFNPAVSPNGEIFVTGEMEAAADFDGDGVHDLPAPNDRDGFIARFDSEGEFLGATGVGVVGAVTFGSDGDVYLGSQVGESVERRYGPADFDGDGRADVAPKGGPTSAAIARYSADGDLKWVRSYALENPAGMAVRGDQIVVSGNYHGVRDLDEDGQPERVDRTVDPEDETDLAILILSTEDGRPVKVWTAPGPGNDWANAVAFAPDSPALYVAGSIQLTADFTGDGEFGEGWAVCENLGDVFFAQYRLGGAFTLQAARAEIEEQRAGRLSWSGSGATRIDVYRDNEIIATVENSGAFTDMLGRTDTGQGAGPWDYRVCEAGTQVCSNQTQISFPNRPTDDR